MIIYTSMSITTISHTINFSWKNNNLNHTKMIIAHSGYCYDRIPANDFCMMVYWPAVIRAADCVEGDNINLYHLIVLK